MGCKLSSSVIVKNRQWLRPQCSMNAATFSQRWKAIRASAPVGMPPRQRVERLMQSGGGRGLVYAVASFTGLRRGEIQSLQWPDLHLDVPRPFIVVRAATTKNKKTAQIPLVPGLVAGLKALRDERSVLTGKVFHRGVPKPRRFRKDLVGAKIPYLDELGRRVDFHALRHTFDSMLHNAGVLPRVVMELMRHSDIRVSTHTYADTSRLPTFSEMGKLPLFLPSPIASPNSAKTRPNAGKVVQSGSPILSVATVVTAQRKTALTITDQSCPPVEMAEREGFEPPGPCGPPDFESGAIDHSATSP